MLFSSFILLKAFLHCKKLFLFMYLNYIYLNLEKIDNNRFTYNFTSFNAQAFYLMFSYAYLLFIKNNNNTNILFFMFTVLPSKYAFAAYYVSIWSPSVCLHSIIHILPNTHAHTYIHKLSLSLSITRSYIVL